MLVTVVLAACSNNKTEYRTEAVTRGGIEQTVTATGTVNPVTTVQVGTQVSGTIKRLYVDFNSPVKKDQVIAEIDPETFIAQVQQARANVVKADAQLKDSERTFKRNQLLLAKNMIAQSDLDTAETNYETNVALLDQAKASLRMAETNLAYTKIVSPVSGVVISRNVDVGQTVAASFQTPTLFTIARDLTKMQIDTNIAESDIGRVKLGQAVNFTVDAYPDSTFEGKVWQIRQAPITVQNVVTYDVVIQVNNRDLRLMPGMTANASVVIATKQNVLRITNAALRFRLTDRTQAPAAPPAGGEKKGPSVWVLENGKPKRVVVSLGISDGTYTEALSDGLQEGQQLIVEAIKKNKGQTGPSGPRMF